MTHSQTFDDSFSENDTFVSSRRESMTFDSFCDLEHVPISFESSLAGGFYHESFQSFAHELDDDESTIMTAADLVEEEACSKRVTFTTTATALNIPIVLGDHPACSNGPPIEFHPTYEDAFISFEPIKFSGKEKAVSGDDREARLRRAGYSSAQLQTSTDSVSAIQASRCQSLIAVFSVTTPRGHVPLSKQERVWIDRIVFRERPDTSDSITKSILGGFKKLFGGSLSNKSASKPVEYSKPTLPSSSSTEAGDPVQSSIRRKLSKHSLLARSA